MISSAKATFVADKDEIRPQYQSPVSGAAVFSSTVVRDLGPQFNAGSTIDKLDSIPITQAGQMQEVVAPWYSDQILPFDVTITGANEYGAMCAAKIFGIEILNEGWGSSIDDAVSLLPNHPTYQVSPSCRQPSPSRARGDGEGSGALPALTFSE
jgi:hypothetical protein